MDKHYPPLSVTFLKPGIGFQKPIALPEIIHWEDPAVQAMIDFKYVKPELIGSEETIDTALLAIKNCFYHVLLVVDREQKVMGLVSAEDLLGEKPLKAIQEKRLSRSELSVGMVMIPQGKIMAIHWEDLRHAKVAQVVHTLNTHKQHFAVVIKQDEHTNEIIVRGLFSVAQMSRQLGRDVTDDPLQVHSIAELQHDLHLND